MPCGAASDAHCNSVLLLVGLALFAVLLTSKQLHGATVCIRGQHYMLPAQLLFFCTVSNDRQVLDDM